MAIAARPSTLAELRQQYEIDRANLLALSARITAQTRAEASRSLEADTAHVLSDTAAELAAQAASALQAGVPTREIEQAARAAATATARLAATIAHGAPPPNRRERFKAWFRNFNGD